MGILCQSTPQLDNTLRGGARYFRAFVDEDKREGGYFKFYGFLRATFGVTFRFRGN
jgi:hypothetical protein